MPVPTIIVFTENPATEKESRIVKAFSDMGYAPLSDSVHNNNYQYFQNNFLENYRLYVYSHDRVYEFKTQDLSEDMLFSPDFSISFNNQLEIEESMWHSIRQFLNYHITQHGHTKNLHQSLIDEAAQFMTKPTVQISSLQEISTTTNNTHYEIQTKYLEQLDIQLYEITKPNTDLPYTSVTRQFSKTGHLPFFSSLFICDSWGVCNDDIQFLFQLWKFFNMEGEYNPEELYKARVESCYPSPTRIGAPEPEVYRRKISDVEQTIYNMLDGKPCDHRSKKTKFIPNYITDQ
jgi:hypothetical protein